MKKIIFFLAMLFCPSIYAATLTTNTVPYVCQGGTNPQLCNSNITTDNNGNANTGFGNWQAESFNTIYQSPSDGFIVGYATQTTGNTIYTVYTDSNPNPSTVRQIGYGTSQPGNTIDFSCPVRKGDYWEVTSNGKAPIGLYFIAN